MEEIFILVYLAKNNYIGFQIEEGYVKYEQNIGQVYASRFINMIIYLTIFCGQNSTNFKRRWKKKL